METEYRGPCDRSPLLSRSSQDRQNTNNSGLSSDAEDEPAEIERQVLLAENDETQNRASTEVTAGPRLVLSVVSIGIYLSAADSTLIVASYSKIGSDMHALNHTSWIALGYFLTLTAFQPLYGKLSDIFGRKQCLMVSYLIFGSGCLFCGISRTVWELFAARLWQGIGGGGMTTVVAVLLNDIVPTKERGIWQGVLNIIYAIGAGTGGPIGAAFADSSLGWRWAFLVQIPLCLVAFLSVQTFLKVPLQEHKSLSKNISRIDFLGALTLLVAVVCLLVGLDRWSNTTWSNPLAYGSLTAFAALGLLFVIIEAKVASEPFAPAFVIFHRELFPSYLASFFGFGSNVAVDYNLSMYYQASDGVPATFASLLLIPGTIMEVTGTLFAGIIIRRTGKLYLLNAAGYTSLAIGNGLIFLSASLLPGSKSGLLVGQMISHFGSGVGLITTLIALVSNAPPGFQAIATALTYLFRSLGSTISISMTSIVVQQSLRQILTSALHGVKDLDEIVDGVRKSLGFLEELSPEIVIKVRRGYGEAITRGFGLIMAVSACAAISSYFLKHQKRL